ncbi:MAG TPA: esterase-like activity of phytase family protein [Chitinophagaceae bacterium]|jgi:uncharacterized protein YjiK|nr:esterase-like activity of phytase family protein [Chitinophagaceae bacterium]
MYRSALVICALFSFTTLSAQPPQVFDYTIGNVNLPYEMNNQVCISGMKFYKGQLYFASERCPFIFVFDPATASISKTISLRVPQEFEMEGLTSYKDKLYLVSENVAAVYEVEISTGAIRQVSISQPLPPKSKGGDGMEGIAANEKSNKFYLLRERNENMSQSQIYTYTIEPGAEDNSFSLKYESMIELPLLSPQWRYSDICYDKENDRLICLKSFSKGKLRQQFIESLNIDKNGNLEKETLKNIPVENFSEISNQYKDQDYSMNLEGVTVDASGAIYIISDNTSGKAQCGVVAKEKTILLYLKKK